MSQSIESDFNKLLKLKGFNAYRLTNECNTTRVYSRKDFYKICLTTGKSEIHYADRTFHIDGTVLFFGNPRTPYSWKTLNDDYKGFTCLFSQDFMQLSERSETLLSSPLFKISGTPILQVGEDTNAFLTTIFEKLIQEQQTNYVHKDDLVRNYINLIIHEALKLQPSNHVTEHKNAATRITAVFLDLLERQFPIEKTSTPLNLKTAQDYAKNLNIHVNHLNKAVNETTGKSTSNHIAERVLAEAKAILQHTDWNISEIAYSLGFEYNSYFNNFFKRHTGTNPKAFRNEK